MLPASIRAIWFGLIALPPITGCTSMVKVQEAETDQFTYLQKAFAVSSLPARVTDEITASDAGPLPFSRLTILVTLHPDDVERSGTAPAYQARWTIVNAGGPFVQVLEERTRNRVPTVHFFSVSYRNVFPLRSQRVLFSKQITEPAGQIKSFRSFSPIARPGDEQREHTLGFRWGGVDFGSESHEFTLHCEAGRRYAATSVHAKFLGDAQELQCDEKNEYGVIQSRFLILFLEHYGIGLERRYDSATWSTTNDIDDVQIQ